MIQPTLGFEKRLHIIVKAILIIVLDAGQLFTVG
jgi:hypothetical protein